GESFSVAGFVHAPTRLIDITNPAQPLQVAFKTVAQGGAYALQGAVPWTTSGTHTFLALSESRLSSPVTLAPHSPSNLHFAQPGAEVVMLSAPQFTSQLQPLVSLHRAEAKSVAMVNVDAVYDEFNFGERTPYAIKSFLKTATS